MNNDEQHGDSLKQRHDQLVQNMTNQEVSNLYGEESVKLKIFCQLNLRGLKRPTNLSHPNTLMMHLCKRELERRGLPIPKIDPFEGQSEMPQELKTVSEINHTLNEVPPKAVYCAVASSYKRPFVYQVYRARTREGVLEVQTINRWEVPLMVYALPGGLFALLEEADKEE
ncbi:hypothetical protein [Dictyobacter kobayashii]|uniref:Uncharacterized protein n=1 Tax=Dictyobacter kobayashii TaxID=2014872 RepID=A0A402AHU4_9CHLR|nr:hypothetical protein [Dictyobacter kobayashii]GCE18669.1 hypothetical protein KDK_24690 [Dictyobacter kobayashii]